MKRKAANRNWWASATDANDIAYKRRTLIEGAMRNLQLARDALALADAPRTLARVRLAITSAGGAIRHADARFSRAQRTE